MPRVLPAGECALVVEFGARAETAFHDQVLALDAALAAQPIDGVLETVPTYRSLMIHFDPHRLCGEELGARIGALAIDTQARAPGRHWRIPACYDGPHGEDLAEVAEALGGTMGDVVRLHVEAAYSVVMYGFAPGFVFLAGLPDALYLSRRATPRPPAPPGALTIANGQALIASVAMPTGWYVVGRTPIATFDPRRDSPFPIAVGDTLGFERVGIRQFDALLREPDAWIAAGS